MTGSNREPGDFRHEDDSIENEGEPVDFVGITFGGDSVFYRPGSDSLFAGERENSDERVVPVPGSERDLSGESLGDAIESIGERVGWESLSAFGKRRLEGESEDGDGDGS
jgi:hypothetical protein